MGKSTLIGIYAISGTGKSTLLKKLTAELDEKDFKCYEGTLEFSKLLPGGRDAMYTASWETQRHWRGQTIKTIGEECTRTGQTGIVAVHALIWWRGRTLAMWNDSDFETYTHIIYLDVPVDIIFTRRKNDLGKRRGHQTVEKLEQWQKEEIAVLEKGCREYGVVFERVQESERALEIIKAITSEDDEDTEVSKDSEDGEKAE